MTAMTQCPKDAPVMKAWENYKRDTEFANTRKWALHDEHVDGSLWTAFYTGYFACAVDSTPTQETVERGEAATLSDERLDKWRWRFHREFDHEYQGCAAEINDLIDQAKEANRLRERLAQWMLTKGFATGHGDTFDDLLWELTWQIDELRANRDAGISFIRVIGEELVNAGLGGGDRTVILANVRAIIKERDELRRRLAEKDSQ